MVLLWQHVCDPKRGCKITGTGGGVPYLIQQGSLNQQLVYAVVPNHSAFLFEILTTTLINLGPGAGCHSEW